MERKPQGSPDTSYAVVTTTAAERAGAHRRRGGWRLHVPRARDQRRGRLRVVEQRRRRGDGAGAAERPTTLDASDGVGQSVLTWVDTSNNETGFKVERKPLGSPDTSYVVIATKAPACRPTPTWSRRAATRTR